MKNVGKKFEDNFKKSIPSYCLIYRLKDSAQAYNNSPKTKFTWNNPCDFFCFDSKIHLLYAFELKSTKYKSMNFQKDENDNSSKMIKHHQVCSLIDMSKYDGVVSGFVFNFRDEKNETERAYFQDIKDFVSMCEKIDKSSFNEMDLILNNAVKIDAVKKRVNYQWDIDGFLTRNNSEE